MAGVVAATVGVSAVAGLIGANQQRKAAEGAANAQRSATTQAIGFQREQLAEQQRQFDLSMQEYNRKQQLLEQQWTQTQTMLAPYMQAGQGALYEMMALSGLASPQYIARQAAPQLQQYQTEVGTTTAPIGSQTAARRIAAPQYMPQGTIENQRRQQAAGQISPQTQLPNIQQAASPYAGMTGTEAQQAAISGIAESPIMQEYARQQEQAMLQNAAATGGLRGGNVQGALAQFRPALLREEIDRQYSRLAQISGMGQTATTQAGSPASLSTPTLPGMDTSVANLMGQYGQANAQQILAQGQTAGNLASQLGQATAWGIGSYFNRPTTPYNTTGGQSPFDLGNIAINLP